MPHGQIAAQRLCGTIYRIELVIGHTEDDAWEVGPETGLRFALNPTYQIYLRWITRVACAKELAWIDRNSGSG